jgi:lipopolysaccharide biosynthesis glycosyltransferase
LPGRDSSPVRVFVGYDPREAVAFHVLSHSIQRHASRPVSITALSLSQLDGLMWRERHELQSTDFSFSRFLVPYLCDFEGWAVFMDCDMLVLDDIASLWALRDERYAVQVVQHDHRPEQDTKFLAQPQTSYEKKNWSSVMLLNNGRCSELTPEYVNTASGLDLHRFHWLENDDLIGELPHRWNHLVDYDPVRPPEELSNLHFTSGGPWFEEFSNCGYADLWYAERDRMMRSGGGASKS